LPGTKRPYGLDGTDAPPFFNLWHDVIETSYRGPELRCFPAPEGLVSEVIVQAASAMFKSFPFLVLASSFYSGYNKASHALGISLGRQKTMISYLRLISIELFHVHMTKYTNMNFKKLFFSPEYS
jgi:hypothetical protein